MLMPKRVKRRRQMRGRMKGKANKGNIVAYGEYVQPNRGSACRYDEIYPSWRSSLGGYFPS